MDVYTPIVYHKRIRILRYGGVNDFCVRVLPLCTLSQIDDSFPGKNA